MNPWLESALARAANNVELQNDCLSAVRAASLAQLQSISWPTRKTEDWKYTSLKVLENTGFNAEVAKSDYTAPVIEGLDSLDILLVDGQLVTDIESLSLPVGLSLTTAQNLPRSSQYWVNNTFAKVKPQKHLFGLVNDVLVDSVLVLDVAEGAQIEKPIRVVYLSRSGNEGHCRVLMNVGENAKAVVVEQFGSLAGEDKSFVTGFAEYQIQANASLEHYRFELQDASALSAGGCHFSLHKEAKLNSTFVGFGSELSRTDIDIQHKGELADAKLNTIYLLKGNERFDLHSTIEHEVPNCTSLENVRGIVADSGQATFNGRIHIHRDAQKTLAELNNRNLLLSDKAQINTKPELEIYADDVRCAHGATVAELDKKALYYLMSRGISKEKALVMLNFGFINALVDEMPNQIIAEWLRPVLHARFAHMCKQSPGGEK